MILLAKIQCNKSMVDQAQLPSLANILVWKSKIIITDDLICFLNKELVLL